MYDTNPDAKLSGVILKCETRTLIECAKLRL